MSQHYFTAQPEAAHSLRHIELNLSGVHLQLVTDAGVFSRTEVDPGTILLLKSVAPPESGAILDLGCGYGPVGLYYAALCPHCVVHMTDINERAVELARTNARQNQLDNVVVHAGDGFQPLAGLSFQLIVTNPPIRAGRRLLLELFTAAYRHLEPGGRFAFVARTQQGAKTLAKEVAGIFGNIAEIGKGGGYRVYSASRHSGA